MKEYKKNTGHEIWDSGYGTSDSEFETRDSRYETWDLRYERLSIIERDDDSSKSRHERTAVVTIKEEFEIIRITE